MPCDKHIGNFIGDCSVLFGFLWRSGRARTKMVGPRPYLVYSWRRHCYLKTIAIDSLRHIEAVLSANLATAWLLVIKGN